MNIFYKDMSTDITRIKPAYGIFDFACRFYQFTIIQFINIPVLISIILQTFFILNFAHLLGEFMGYINDRERSRPYLV